MDQCGPWTLEDLDLFSPSIDALSFSLDSDVWNTACFRYGEGSVASIGFVTADGLRERTVNGAINSAATVTAEASRILDVQGFVTASGTVVTAADRLRVVSGAIAASGFVSAVAGTTQDSAVVTKVMNGVATITANGAVVATLYKYGEEWVIVPDEATTWTASSIQSDTWTVVSSGTDTWLRQG
jgi:hypothetical protein